MTTTNGNGLGTSREDFGKHYASMYEGSMVGAGANVFAVMGYVIAKQVPGKGANNPDDLFIELNPKLLAFILGGEEREITDAIEYLCAPDPDSRSKAEGGARLVREGQFLYRVVNGRKYRLLRSPERRREQFRAAKQRQRERERLQRQVAAESAGREARFVRADAAGDQAEADRVAGEGL